MLFCATGLFVVALSCRADEPVVPKWFHRDPENPYAVFDAWRHLSTTEASLYRWSKESEICAGILRDQQGRPIGYCPLSVGYHDGLRGYGGYLKTDKDGFFYIDSVPRPQEVVKDVLNYRGSYFSAAPGYPFSEIGMAFAFANEGFKKCQVKVVPVPGMGLFVTLTCPPGKKYDEGEFHKFAEREMADREEGYKRWLAGRRSPLTPWEMFVS
jgi:hypothetical protein